MVRPLSNKARLACGSALAALLTLGAAHAGGDAGLHSLSGKASLNSPRMLFKDNFDKDTAGQFPSDWTLTFDGEGAQYQAVNTTHSVSRPNALNLVGSECWSANAYHPVAMSMRHIVLSGALLVGEAAKDGCGPDTARISLLDPSQGEWGTPYTGVQFNDDGYMYAVSGSSWPKLRGYKINRWYKIVVEVDLVKQTSSIYVDGKLVGRNLPFAASGTPTGVELAALHGDYSTAWFDNISVGSQ